ncbi:LuxR family transcriptional regulator [Mesorhizobium sp. M2A.F.Ca.ET.040.01.1.1]|nr:LuxR family transcriptional regulator [Mesorhizobium sp. M2A.F.Ca.ET.040.01.1.1]
MGVARPDRQASPAVSAHLLPSLGVHPFWWTPCASGHSTAKGAEKFALTTGRQHQILTLIAQGKTNAVIAAEIGLSKRTVETHRLRLADWPRLSMLKAGRSISS